MKKTLIVLAAAIVLGVSGITDCRAESGDFILPEISFSKLPDNIDFQEITPVEASMPARAAISSTDLIISGTIGGYRQTCRVSDKKLLCALSDNKNNDQSETNELLLARKIYLDRMVSVWEQSYDIREACPSATQHVCTGGVVYDCKHTKTTTTERVSRTCTADDINAEKCDSDGMIWEEVKVEKCDVSCSETSKACTMPKAG